MKLLDLHLQNIGPFLNDTIEFATSENAQKQVTIITGENGTGKTIILDAIRKMILANGGNYSRNIFRKESHNKVELSLKLEDKKINLHTVEEIDSNFQVCTENGRLFQDLQRKMIAASQSKNNLWIINYWTSQNDNDTFNIPNVGKIIPENYLLGSLSGIQKNKKTTEILTFFDFYQTSYKETQQKEGEFIFEKIKEIFKISLNQGELKYIDRETFLPIIEINGNEISIEKLSSGNLYLIQRMLDLLSQMYSVYKLNPELVKLEDMMNTPGVLLIDEAENHLHPKWQKTFLNSILKIFPHLQIIATTHSPFIVGSVDGAKVYVCKAENDHSVIVDETNVYSNKPIDEILISDVFAETQPFASKDISDKIEQRKQAIKSGNKDLENQLERELLDLNPQYFSYFEIDDLIERIKNQ